MFEAVRRYALIALLALSPLAGEGVRAEVSLDAAAKPATSALFALAQAVSQEGAIAQADFAAIALGAVIDAYEQELATIAESARRLSKKQRAKQQRWAAAATRLLDQLYDARDNVSLGDPVEVVASGPGEVQVLVGEQMLPVASPRIGRNDAFEAAVVADYCAYYPCDAALVEVASAAPRSLGGWSFGQGRGSTYLTADGLGFMFSSVRDRGLKEELCRRAADELRQVLAILKRAVALGIDINWNSLHVVPDSGAGAERLVVGYEGQGSHIPLPILLRAPGILDVAQPWLRARVSERSAQQMFPRSDLLFSNLLGG